MPEGIPVVCTWTWVCELGISQPVPWNKDGQNKMQYLILSLSCNMKRSLKSNTFYSYMSYFICSSHCKTSWHKMFLACSCSADVYTSHCEWYIGRGNYVLLPGVYEDSELEITIPTLSMGAVHVTTVKKVWLVHHSNYDMPRHLLSCYAVSVHANLK
jgi:hypothetical protein